MKTHAIVQGFAICLLLMWTAVWDVPLSDAGGPPVRLAIRTPDERAAIPISSGVQLLPTEWNPPTQLIPTILGRPEMQMISGEFESGNLHPQRQIRRQRETRPISTDVEPQEELAAKSLNEEHKFYVLGMTPEPVDIKTFLDIHVSRGPFRHVETELERKSSMNPWSWDLGDQSWELFVCPEQICPGGWIDWKRNYCQALRQSTFDGTMAALEKPWWPLKWHLIPSQFAPRPFVSVAKQRPGRFNTVELDQIGQLLAE